MTYILVDTSIFIRLKGIYQSTFDCILETCDVIAYTKEILNEYKGRARSSILFHLLPFLRELENRGKLGFFARSLVVSRVRRHENVRRINYPPHNKDRKWIKVAIAIRAKYIISTNNHLLRLVPNRCNDDIIEIIQPFQYTNIRCSNEN